MDITIYRNASNRLQSMLLRQGQSKIQQCKISLSNCLSVKEANEVLDKDNNISGEFIRFECFLALLTTSLVCQYRNI